MSSGWRPVLAAAVAGLGVALLVTLLQPTTHRASGTIVLTREGRAPGDDPTLAPAAAAAAELLASSTVAESVVANLRLETSAEDLLERTDTSVGDESSLLSLSVEAVEPEEARRAAQEVAQVFTVLYNSRFGPATTASIWEAPRAEADAVSPKPARNLAVGGLLGAAIGFLLVLLLRRRRGKPAQQPSRAIPVVSAAGPWTIDELERLAASPPLAPERRAELARLVTAMREFSGPGGAVPRRLDQLVRDSFGELLAR